MLLKIPSYRLFFGDFAHWLSLCCHCVGKETNGNKKAKHSDTDEADGDSQDGSKLPLKSKDTEYQSDKTSNEGKPRMGDFRSFP